MTSLTALRTALKEYAEKMTAAVEDAQVALKMRFVTRSYGNALVVLPLAPADAAVRTVAATCARIPALPMKPARLRTIPSAWVAHLIVRERYAEMMTTVGVGVLPALPARFAIRIFGSVSMIPLPNLLGGGTIPRTM